VPEDRLAGACLAATTEKQEVQRKAGDVG